jgi:hypothetical protein
MCKKEFKGKKKLELDLKQIWGAGTFYPPQISETPQKIDHIEYCNRFAEALKYHFRDYEWANRQN